MTTYYLMNSVQAGPHFLTAGTLIDDTLDDIAAIIGAGGIPHIASDPIAAAAAQGATEMKRKGAPHEQIDAFVAAVMTYGQVTQANDIAVQCPHTGAFVTFMSQVSPLVYNVSNGKAYTIEVTLTGERTGGARLTGHVGDTVSIGRKIVLGLGSGVLDVVGVGTVGDDVLDADLAGTNITAACATDGTLTVTPTLGGPWPANLVMLWTYRVTVIGA
jgi:hypothetical protein